MSRGPLAANVNDGSCVQARGWVAAVCQKTVAVVMRSKGLPQCDEDLCGFNSSDWIQVVSDVKADRPDGGRVSQANTDRVRVVGSKISEANVLEHISSVVEGSYAQSLLQGHGNTEFGIDD